jgi:hypothetical protein
VIGAGEDGSYVYFVANGVLGDGAAHGATSETCCNLYVRHAGVTTFIAVLTGNDLYNPQTGDLLLSLSARGAQVAPDGHSLVFMSEASLTGYDNHFLAAMLPEAYVYAADSGQLSCVSCNPTGTSPTNSSSVSLPGSFSGSFMHRWISEDGSRVFFESTEALVAQDTNGKQDVYEWERNGTGACKNARGCVYLLSGGTSTDNSYFLDASANGDDVFIISRAQLSPLDLGETFEVYDVRVGASQPLARQACSGTGCQGLPAATPPFATPSSVTFNGVGNFSSLPPAVVKPTKKTVKCAKPKKLSHGKCIKTTKKKTKTKKAKRASNDRRASR